MMNSAGYSLADIAAATGGSNNHANDGMWGGNGSWLWIIVVFALLFGWGGNGFGGFGNGGAQGGATPYATGAYTDAAVQRGFDNQAVVTKLDGITQGICDSTYALNSSIQNGFAGVNSALCQGFNGTNTAMLQGFNGVERGFCNLSAQLAQCCCDTGRAIERGFADTNYNMATQACDTRNLIQSTTRDIIDGQNANTRAILDFLTQDKISSLQAENQSLKFAASQNAQNAFITANQSAQTAELIRRLGADCPQPAYVVQPPTPVNFPVNGCGNFTGYGNNCGCNGCC